MENKTLSAQDPRAVADHALVMSYFYARRGDVHQLVAWHDKAAQAIKQTKANS